MKPVGLILDANSILDITLLAKKAEDANFDSVWATELYRTTFQQLSAVANSTHNIKLGTAVALAFVRSPLITSLTALDLDEISNGRLILGLGTGAKRTNEMWHGINHGKPVTRIKECIELIKLISSGVHNGDELSFEGEYYNISTKGYHRAFKPVRESFPIYLAGVGSNMISASAEVADGYLGHVVCSLRYIKEVVSKSIQSGLERSSRSKKNFKICSIITCAISENKKDALEAARATIAFYATVRTYEPPFKLHGFQEQTERIRDAFFKRDTKTMIKSVSDDMVHTFAVVGTASECRNKIDEYREYLDLPILSAPHYYLDFEEVKMYQDAIIDTFGQ
ncbi:MAG: LLM class flavin-dependent oxidoreductase [Thermodesulfobacteriales bacterium]|nr:MAG: LLM class flavin-dependent oxidoreductase [Thermodesulfobacteriales bacterium]